MARPYPTDAEILEIRPDITEYMREEDDLQSYADKALTKFKIDLEDKRGVFWSRVYDETNGIYFVGSDSRTRNDDKIPRMLAYQVVTMIFKDYSIRTSDSQWWDLSEYYKMEYEEMLRISKLDIDDDDSGTITVDEDGQTGQVYMGR